MDTAASWRGGQQQVLYLLRGLAARGDRPVLAAPRDGELSVRARGAGIRVIPLSSRGDLDARAGVRLRRALAEGVDVLHLHSGRAHALGLLATLGLRHRPAVIVSRRVDFPIKGGWGGRLKYGPRVDRFITVSHEVARVLREGGVPGSRIVTVHSACDPSRMDVPGDPEGLRRELAVPEEMKLIAFVGALVGHKSPGDLLEALPDVPGAVLLFAGKGGLEGSLRQRARELGVLPRVRFLGHREDVPRLLRSADVYSLPSRMEGLGTSVLDAMAAEVPVVGTRAGGIPEMVEDGVSGLLVPPGRPDLLAGAVRRILEDPSLARALVAGARARVRLFSVDRMVDGTRVVYEDALGG